MPVNETLKALPFEHLIGSPLKAAIEAQSLAAKATIDFIQQVGFTATDPYSGNDPSEIPKKADYGEVRNVVFKYTATNDDGTQRVAELTVPILTIIPIPYLRIDNMTIDFTANITETMTEKTNTQRNSNTSGGVSAVVPFWIPAKVGFKASVSKSSSSSSSSRYKTEYTMAIHLTAVQDDMPAGLSKVLNILENSIKENTSIGTGTPITTLTLTIQKLDGTAIASASVLLIGHSNEPQVTGTTGDTLGKVSFSTVAYGNYTVQINKDGQQFSENIIATAGTTSHTIKIDYTTPA